MLLIVAAVILGATEPPAANPTAVAEVKAGKRKEADAAWWGYDPVNATAAVQGAIDSGAKKVTIPNVGSDWIVDPVFLKSDQEIVFQKGVVIAARKGGFQGKNDCLLRAVRQKNVTIRGYGATLRMNKEEYTEGEWRMGIELDSCTNVKILGLTVTRSGGDGLYLGNRDEAQPYCKDIEVRDCVFDDHRRQGMSVISVDGLLVENCVFKNTSGTAPQAGLDLEPNLPTERLTGIVVRKCRFEDNAGPGILVYTGTLTAQTAPMSVLFEKCEIRSAKSSGIEIGGSGPDFPSGKLAFRDCRIADCFGPGLNVFSKSPGAYNPVFEKCSWTHVAFGKETGAPIQLTGGDSGADRYVGGVIFIGCMLDDQVNRPFLAAPDGGACGLFGTLKVTNSHGARMALGDKAKEIELEYGAKK